MALRRVASGWNMGQRQWGKKRREKEGKNENVVKSCYMHERRTLRKCVLCVNGTMTHDVMSPGRSLRATYGFVHKNT